MTPYTEAENRWTIDRRERGYRRVDCPLHLYWEVSGDPVSDDYTVDEISAAALFRVWENDMRSWKEFDGDNVRIHWFVGGGGIFDAAPTFRPGMVERSGFDKYFYPPRSSVDGSPINWSRIPVVDKLWRPSACNKGGFIQEATGWKPGVLQRSVSLGFLRSCVDAEYEILHQKRAAARIDTATLDLD